MSAPLVYPVLPQQLRAAVLEAAMALVAAERALVRAWVSVPLAPMPPGALPDDPADGAPAEAFPLGGYGSLVADLRATLDSFLILGQGPADRLWTPADAAAADLQLPSWRTAANLRIDRSVLAAGEVRMGVLAALRYSIEAQRDLAILPPCVRLAPALEFLRQAGTELVKISRAPDGEL